MHKALVALALLIATVGCAASAATSIPAGLRASLPAGYRTLASTTLRIDAARVFQIVALGLPNETRGRAQGKRSPARPLMIWQRSADGRSYRLIGRNDHVVLRADEGGQCDPFEDGMGGEIIVKARSFTVRNAVACGFSHWEDDIGFRFDTRINGFVFSSHRFESWSLNPSADPDAEAMISDGARVLDTERKPPVPFAKWRPKR